MLVRMFWGLTILSAGWFPSFRGENIQIHPHHDAILLDGQEIACIGCNPLVLGHKLWLNQATQEQLEALPRIGEKKARLILDLRDKKQGFQDIRELEEVKGIGPKTIELLRPYLRVH